VRTIERDRPFQGRRRLRQTPALVQRLGELGVGIGALRSGGYRAGERLCGIHCAASPNQDESQLEVCTAVSRLEPDQPPQVGLRIGVAAQLAEYPAPGHQQLEVIRPPDQRLVERGERFLRPLQALENAGERYPRRHMVRIGGHRAGIISPCLAVTSRRLGRGRRLRPRLGDIGDGCAGTVAAGGLLVGRAVPAAVPPAPGSWHGGKLR